MHQIFKLHGLPLSYSMTPWSLLISQITQQRCLTVIAYRMKNGWLACNMHDAG